MTFQEFVARMNVSWLTVAPDGGIEVDCVAACIAFGWPPSRENQDAIKLGVLDAFKEFGVPTEKLKTELVTRRPQFG